MQQSAAPALVRLRELPLAGPTVAAGAALAACVAAGIADPARGVGLPCPFHALTGLWCPGCGSTRALHALTRGDVAGMASQNPLLVVLLPYLAWAWAAWTVRSAGGPALWTLSRSRKLSLALLVVIIAFGVARNLPWEPLRILGPH